MPQETKKNDKDPDGQEGDEWKLERAIPPKESSKGNKCPKLSPCTLQTSSMEPPTEQTQPEARGMRLQLM